MYEVDRETFEGLVTSAVEDLPNKFRDRVTNLEFAVEDLAGSDDYAGVGGGRGRTPEDVKIFAEGDEGFS